MIREYRNMKILITGALGFVGRYAVRECEAAGHTVFRQDIAGRDDMIDTDITDAEAMRALVENLQPEACIHLAGITDVASGWKDPNGVYSANLCGTVNLLEAFRATAPRARILVVSSSQIYNTVRVYDDLNEKVHFMPANIYSISKLSADLTTLAYGEKYGLNAFTARPINHIGPDQSERFVVSAFATQLKRISAGIQEPRLKVGNLASRRDFLDVRDVVRAYRLLMERGQAGESYNIAGGKLVKIEDVLAMLARISGVSPETEVDPELYRPTDSSPTLDTSKLRRTTAWKPEIDLEDTLRDIYKAVEI